jgi:transcriptional regulator with PAS, ATPase and Fis domain
LILGESGTGKELVAQAIHARKGQASLPFVSINCGSIPRTIIESEFFGIRANYPGFHNKDPLTGKLEASGKGTLFLDEIGNMEMGAQASLLRVLEERRFTPFGGTGAVPFQAQVIASTNVDLDAAISDGRFRKDLYYRLNEVPIVMPPLRDRKEDIPLLVRYFLNPHETRSGSRIEILPEALEKLTTHNWPGNVRELSKVIQHAVTICQSQYLTPKHFDLSPHGSDGSETRGETDDKRKRVSTYREQMLENEKTVLLAALEQSGWNQAKAAKRLKLYRTNLIRLMKRHGIKVTRGSDKK